MTDSIMPPVEQRTSTERKQEAGEKVVSIVPETSSESAQVYLPRIAIKFCTQCKWMLRAAYFGQELLSTFNTSLGEVALIPTTGGVFTVTIFHASDDTSLSPQETLLWDRKLHGGFPEVKQLKSLVRNIVDPARDLGHVDRALGKAHTSAETAPTTAAARSGHGARVTATDGDQSTGLRADGAACEDCQ